MRKILTLAAAFALCATTQAFAIIGAGAHYIMNTGSLKSSQGVAKALDQLGNIEVRQESADALQGLGFKLWIDFLPLIDIEGTFNIAASRYQSFLIIPIQGIDEIPLEYAPDAPYNMLFDKASPIFGVVNGDLSITYPFDLPIIRPYIGAGISYFASIPIVNASFTKKLLDSSPELVEALIASQANADEAGEAASKIGNVLAKTLKDESYTTGIGGHIIAGVRIKPPILPVAIYTNGKYYFGGNTNSQFTQGFVLEVGGGFAL
ncbi:MAG: hypothetical protein FWB90_06730 [Fibromonadales bacterium]|nr:hypothetical protein [Fibromonadales bacterium]